MRFSSGTLAAFLAAPSMGLVANAFVPAAPAAPPRRSATTATAAFRAVDAARRRPSSTTTLGPLFSTAEADTEATASDKETYEFTSDVGRVMDLIINSLYSDKDIFLRELVSNAADACDKKRFLSLTSSSSEGEDDAPAISLRADPDAQTITIQDTGVGMTKAEMVNNLGKIAQSGTKAFAEALSQQDGVSSTDAVNLIGQFGVGFYSAFLVADKVEVVSKSMQEGSTPLRWTSTADALYTIEEDNDSEPFASSGTRIILHLKDEAAEYLETAKMEELLQRYSEFIEFPISIYKETTEYETVPDDEANKDLPEGEEPKTKTVPVTKTGYEEVNKQKPLWLRSPKDVTEEEYQSFYKSAFKSAYDEPMKYTHFVLEGQVECKSLLYIPGMLPFELSRDMFDENSRNIRLYVKRVFINDKFEELMPRWLKFVRGVVDSDDLPLNVSREILQKSKVLSIINKRLVRKSLDMIREIAQDEDASKYVMFWNNFGKYLKVGAVEDDVNRKDIAPLLRFFSSASGEEYTSLDAYVDAMPEEQKSIYFVTGDGREGAAMSPVVEKITNKGYDVLLATEPLDEILMENLRSYREKDIVDAAKENLKLDEDDEESKNKKEALKEEYKEVAEYLETLLKDKISKVVVTDQLTDSPAALVQSAYGMSPTMQRYMKAQSVASGGDGSIPGMNQAVLEVNPHHVIVQDLDRMVKAGDKESDELENFALLMYDVASMTSGYDVENTKSFATRVMRLMDEKAGETSPSSSATTAAATSKTAKDKDDDDDDTPAAEAELVA